MNKHSRSVIILFVLVVLISGCEGLLTSGTDSDLHNTIVHNLTAKTELKQWIVLGPFENNEVREDLPDGTRHTGFYTDYLESIGGEEKAILRAGSEVVFKDADGTEQKAVAKHAEAKWKNVVDLREVFGKLDNKVAYAFCFIKSKTDQKVFFNFGSDDGAKVWVNDKLVHKIYAGRGLNPSEDKFNAELKKGLNRLLVKVSQRTSGWAFAVEVLDSTEYAKAQAEERARKDFTEFLAARIVPQYGNYWNYTFGPGKFPKMGWEKPYLTEKVMGKFDLDLRWFDAELNEVNKPQKQGRYAFIADGLTPEGVHIRRGSTMFCVGSEWLAWSERPKAYLEYLPFTDISEQAWEENKEAIALNVGRMVLLSLLNQRDGAVLMSYLDEMQATGNAPSLTDTPIIRDMEYHLALKRKLMDVEKKYPQLKMPSKKQNQNATVLHDGTAAQAGVKDDTADKIRAVCQEWFDKSGEPFVVLVARRGVVVIHEPFGENLRGKITTQTPTPMASVTKLVTGLMFAQFVDQGLIDIDDPVGKYFPDFPVTGDKAITLRQCFTHTTGLYGHEEWGGMHNPYLENVIANGLKHLKPGKVHNYNGMGYDLAGKVMEIVSGKSIFRLMRENFFDPLGLENTVLEEDLGFSCNSTAWDTGIIAQMLLNKGSYGNLQFFSPETFEQIIPKPLKNYYPDIDVEWGIGITWMRQSHPRAGKGDVPKNQTVLSKNIIGHGSATSAVLRVDLDNELVITQTRRIAGKDYNKYLLKLLQTIEQGLID
jgi:CubicO group peptidase (beta-lactamase class C family)